MNKFEKDIISLIKCALGNSTPNLTELDYKSVISFAKRQQIVGLLFYSLNKSDDFKNNEFYAFFYNLYVFNLKISENQIYELNLLFKEFSDNNIDFVPLKGSILKSLYPQTDMRTMGDADILIKTAQIKKIKKIMLSCGFQYDHETDHEIIWRKNGSINIELHKRLIPSYNKDYYEYYGDGWKLINDNKLNNEDTFIFIFTHFAKHYRDKGVGIKYIVDFYVFLNTYKDINKSYIETELKKLQLLEFYNNIMDTISVWFDGKEPTEKTDFITDFIFSCGVYGRQELHAKSEGLKISKKTKKVKSSKFFRLLFPTYGNMCLAYPFLRKFWIALPFMYIVRFFQKVFVKGKVKNGLNVVKGMDKDGIDEYQKQLNYVGLDFNFQDKD